MTQERSIQLTMVMMSYMVDVLDFEFKSVDKMYFEEKESKYGNVGFYYKGETTRPKSNSVLRERG